jgi:hypothetical protein
MSFSYLGVFRQTQWKFFRSFVLRERQAVDPRLAVIEAELRRIGAITVTYRATKTTVRNNDGSLDVATKVTEQREGFDVSIGSSLEKLLIAYIANGGNPTDISLFLQPDTVLMTGGTDPEDDPNDDPNVEANAVSMPGVRDLQPYYGIVSIESTSGYGAGGRNPMGLSTFSRDPNRRIGRDIDISDAAVSIGIKVDWARRWTQQAIQEKRNLMEQRIIKLMDLREQLMEERDEILVQSLGGTVNDIPDLPDPGQFHRELHLSKIVAALDGVFYVKSESGVPDMNSVNLGTGENPTGLSMYDTLWADDPDDDIFSTA